MQLIERYLDAVGQYLPRRKRSDILAEIRSAIEDALEDHGWVPGDSVEEEQAAAVLEEMGPPGLVAQAYQPTFHLIGPRWYPNFITAIQIWAAVFIIVNLIEFGVSLFQAGAPGFWNVFLESFAGWFSAMFASFGVIVAVFAIMERTVQPDDPQTQMKVWMRLQPLYELKESFLGKGSGREGWDPRSLAAVEKKDRVKIGETVFEVVVMVGMLVWLNLYPQWAGIWNPIVEGVAFVPLLAESFQGYLPWINALYLLKIGLDVYLLRQGRWQPATRWVATGLRLAGLAVFYYFLVGPAIFGLHPDYLAFHGLDISQLAFTKDTLLPILNSAFRLAMVVNIIVNLVMMVFRLFPLVLSGIAIPIGKK